MTNQEWAKLNQTAGWKYQIHYLHLMEPILWYNWDGIRDASPNSLRPEDWPEPDGWFWGWNREKPEMLVKEIDKEIFDRLTRKLELMPNSRSN